MISEGSSPQSSARHQFDSSGFHSLDASGMGREAEQHQWSDISEDEHEHDENDENASPHFAHTPSVRAQSAR